MCDIFNSKAKVLYTVHLLFTAAVKEAAFYVIKHDRSVTLGPHTYAHHCTRMRIFPVKRTRVKAFWRDLEQVAKKKIVNVSMKYMDTEKELWFACFVIFSLCVEAVCPVMAPGGWV